MIRFFLFFFILFSSVSFSQINIKENLLGLTTSNSFTFFDVSDTSFTNKVIELRPKVLRFPGGAVGNFYNYGLAAYGLKIKEIEENHAGGFYKRAKGLLRISKKLKHDQNYIDDFINLVELTKSKVILVANMFSKNDDILLMIDKFKFHNIDILGIELGSELSNKSYYDKGYNINKYIEDAQLIAKKIKKKHPEINIGVVAAPIIKQNNHRHSIWNRRLADLSFYDAIIVHSYAKLIKGKDLYGQMISELKEKTTTKESFEVYNNRAVKFLNEDFIKEISSYNKIFSNKSIWITEWNLQISKTTASTMLQALFVANYFLEIASNNKFKNINLTTFHNLAGRDYSGSILMNRNDTFQIHSTYQSIKMISPVFFGKKSTILKKKSKKNIFVYDIFYEKKLKYKIVINWQNDKKYKFKSNNIFKIESYYSEKIYEKDNEKMILDVENKNSFISKPFSISKLTFF